MEITAAQIAALAEGTVEGNPQAAVSGVAKIEEATPGTITFLANPKYTHYIYDTKASVVLVSNDFKPERAVSATLIRVADPYSTVTRLLGMVAELTAPHPSGIEQPCHIAQGVQVPADAYVGAFAYIAEGVTLGAGVKIYPQAYIGRGCSIGEGTVIYPGARIYHGCTVGARCIIHAGAVIGADGFGFAPQSDGSYTKIPQTGTVEIADDVEIGANTTVDRATMGSTRIEHGVKLDNLIMVAHNCVVGHDTVMAAQTGVAGSTHIGAHCMMGGQVGFAGHITVADGVQIGAQSGIPSSIRKPGAYMGTPAVEAPRFLRQSALIKDLPSMADRLRQLEARLKELEGDQSTSK